MRKSSLITAPVRLAFLWTLYAVTLPAGLVWGDSRQEARAEIDRLQQYSEDLSLSDEIRSVEATFAAAEAYFQSQDNGQAEQYYRLTLQKARIIRPAAHHTPELTANSAPGTADSLQTEPQPAEPDSPPPQTVLPDHNPMSAPPDVTAVQEPLQTDPASSRPEEIVSDKLVGSESIYTVAKGDTIRLVAAKLGVTRQHLVKANRLDEKSHLRVGQHLSYNNRKIIPRQVRNGIVVNIPDRTLYYFQQGRLTTSLPVALGTAVKSDRFNWETPTGKFRITAKMKDPTWHVPPSIRSEMEEAGREVITSIPPGADNPLGKYAIKTSIPGILIHSTTKPWSIYSFASHGCIRVYPDRMEEFFKEVKVNTPGEIIYQPVKVAVTENGRVFLEVHRDIYKKSPDGLAREARRLIEKHNLSEKVDWQKVKSILHAASGTAEDVTL